MPAITKTRITAAMEAAEKRVGAEMKDTVWRYVSQMVCKLYTKYLLEELEAKE